MINQISAILLVSEDPKALAEFYARAFGLKFASEEHDDTAEHFGGWLGSAHIGIHPRENFPEASATGEGGVKLAFDTLDFDELIEHLQKEQIPLMYPPKNTGWARMSAIRDPDGNVVEILQPCNEILKSAMIRTRSVNERVKSYLDAGAGFRFMDDRGGGDA